MSEAVLSSRVRLARNFPDMPFDVVENSEAASLCEGRTAEALKLSGQDAGFELLRLRDMEDVQRRALAELHLISQDLLKHKDVAAVLLNEKAGLSIMMNEEDHLRIQAIAEGMDLQAAADACFQVEDALSRHLAFAFDQQLGYLTACPTNTGTGMRASLLMHLPMLTITKQMGNVGQLAAKVGLNIRGVYGGGSEAWGNLYLISNQATLGRTEQEIISAVTAVGQQLTDMELAMREKSLHMDRLGVEDMVFRAWGLMQNARRMGLEEFFKLWSSLRLGAVMGLLPVKTATVDMLLHQAQDANVQAMAEAGLTGRALDEKRAECIRHILNS